MAGLSHGRSIEGRPATIKNGAFAFCQPLRQWSAVSVLLPLTEGEATGRSWLEVTITGTGAVGLAARVVTTTKRQQGEGDPQSFVTV